jgi:uncharacterized phage protein gp47/JayE
VTVTATGFEIRSVEEILAEIEAAQRAASALGPNLDQSPTSVLGQLNAIFANQVRKVEEAMAGCYSAFDPDAAGGDALDNVSSITGTIREPATKAYLGITVNVDPGTYAIGTLILNPVGNPNATLSNAVAIVNGGGSAANVAGAWEATAAGLTAYTTSTVMEITSAVVGWNSIGATSSVTNGTDVEEDADLRARRETELAAPGSTTVDAIRADILQNVAGVLSVDVIENDTDATVDGIPPHAFEVVAYGPDPAAAADDQAVADQIFLSKAAGIKAHGSTEKTVTDAQGYDHAIGLTRPTDLNVYFTITNLVTNDDYATDANLLAEVVAAAEAALGPGGAVYSADIITWAKAVPGVLGLTATVGTAASPTGSVVSPTFRQITRWDVARGAVV